MKGLTRASGARVRGLGAGSGPWLSPSIVRGPGPLSDFSVLISSARNQPSGSQSCEEAQMGQRQGTEPKVRLRRGQAASSAVGANRGRAAVSGHLHWKQRNQQPRMASPATGRRRRPSMRLPGFFRGRREHWAQGSLAEGRETLPITKLKLAQAGPLVRGRAADMWKGLWGTPEQLRGPQGARRGGGQAAPPGAVKSQ